VCGQKAARVLNFNPGVSIDDGIGEIKELLDSNRLRDIDNPRYTNQTYLKMFNTHKPATLEKESCAVASS
jgi:hypothetical protein